MQFFDVEIFSGIMSAYSDPSEAAIHRNMQQARMNTRPEDYSLQSQGSCTALHMAAEQGHTAVAVALVDAGSNVSAKDKVGNTVLHEAARGGYYDIVTLLLRAGAECDEPGQHGYTPLHLACRGGYYDIARSLLEAGAFPTSQSESGETPLELAQSSKHTEVIRLMLGAVAVHNARKPTGYKILNCTVFGCKFAWSFQDDSQNSRASRAQLFQ